METLPQRHGMGRFLALVGTSRHPNYWIAAADFGKQVAKSFQLDEAANHEFVIQGPAPLTYDEAGQRFAQQTQPRRFVFKIPLSLVKALGALSPAMDFNARIMDAVLSYPEAFKAEETWRLLGEPMTTIDEFATRQSR
jgi:hypothetical protein